MRLFWFFVAAALLLGGLQILAWLAHVQYPWSAGTALGLFAVPCCFVPVFTLWVGVAKAGYPLADEIPIHLLILGLPVAAAMLLQWRLP